MIDLVVFDMAGTTVHDGDAVSASFRATLSGWGIEVDRSLVKTVMGLPKPEAIRILLEQCGGQRGLNPTAETINTIHEDFTRRMCDYYATNPAVREIPGATAAFAALRRSRIKVALNTGFYRPIASVLLRRLGWHSLSESDAARNPSVAPRSSMTPRGKLHPGSESDAALARSSMTPRGKLHPTCAIDADVTSDEVSHGRPHPDMIQHLMTRLGIQDPARVAKVGDTRVDLEEGTNAGCSLVIGVTTGAFTREQLQACPHTHILESVADVPALLLADGGTGCT
jgi:phosphoglycolate phosphatase-like HAD superfamily hydrolase